MIPLLRRFCVLRMRHSVAEMGTSYDTNLSGLELYILEVRKVKNETAEWIAE